MTMPGCSISPSSLGVGSTDTKHMELEKVGDTP